MARLLSSGLEATMSSIVQPPAQYADVDKHCAIGSKIAPGWHLLICVTQAPFCGTPSEVAVRD